MTRTIATLLLSLLTLAAGADPVGQRRAILILVQFPDRQFAEGHGAAYYDKLLNQDNYRSDEGFVGSVSDYFRDQSDGQLSLQFDIFGPITLPHRYGYYGENDDGHDARPWQMTIDACRALTAEADFSPYDWDGNGYADQVVLLYAGAGEAETGETDAVCPHEYWVALGADSAITVNGTRVNRYACVSELYGGTTTGIGPLCHEFAHCLGLADMYDTEYQGNYGMGYWSPMDHGSTLGGGFVPCCLTSFERMQCGWLTPIELLRDTVVEGMKPLSEGGEAYIIRNDANENEYYLLENRQPVGWDAALLGRGLLILHVDYDRSVWQNNIVNTTYYPTYNDHQRCTIFHADNSVGIAADNTISKAEIAGDPYPYEGNDSLTNTSTPAATLYNKNSYSARLMNKAITNIRQNDDGTISFTFRGYAPKDTVHEGAYFYESFDKCAGKGGNDDLWSGSIATATFRPDNEGWSCLKSYGADQCARFNTASKVRDVKSPEFTIDGRTTLTFRAGTWKGDGTTLNLSVTGDATIKPTQVEMAQEGWTDFEVVIAGSGTVSIVFSPEKRLFLDEVLAVPRHTTTAIDELPVKTTDRRIYSIDGRYVSTDRTRLQPGIYVVGGKKILVD